MIYENIKQWRNLRRSKCAIHLWEEMGRRGKRGTIHIQLALEIRASPSLNVFGREMDIRITRPVKPLHARYNKDLRSQLERQDKRYRKANHTRTKYDGRMGWYGMGWDRGTWIHQGSQLLTSPCSHSCLFDLQLCIHTVLSIHPSLSLSLSCMG